MLFKILVLTDTPSKPFEIVHCDIFYHVSKEFLTVLNFSINFPKAFAQRENLFLFSQNSLYVSESHKNYRREFKNEIVKELLNKIHNIASGIVLRNDFILLYSSIYEFEEKYIIMKLI